MTLFDYLCMYVDLDETIRIWTKHQHGYGLISKYDLSKPDNMDDTCTVREFFAKTHWLSDYADAKAIGCNDYNVPESYRNELNILIEMPDNFIIK